MEQMKEEDLKRIKQLLEKTGEFVAYLELADTKMMEWKQDIDHHAIELNTIAKSLNEEFNTLKELLNQTGVSTFRLMVEKALVHNHAYLEKMDKSYIQFNQNIQLQQDKFKQLAQQCVEKIEHHSASAMQQVSTHLSRYDVHHFHRIANESCDHVERVAQNAVKKSSRLLQLFQLRFGIFTAITSIITAFIIVLYLSDELPWEMHRDALNERRAGQLLLKAWPNLSHNERTKILSHDSNHRS